MMMGPTLPILLVAVPFIVAVVVVLLAVASLVIRQKPRMQLVRVQQPIKQPPSVAIAVPSTRAPSVGGFEVDALIGDLRREPSTRQPSKQFPVERTVEARGIVDHVNTEITTRGSAVTTSAATRIDDTRQTKPERAIAKGSCRYPIRRLATEHANEDENEFGEESATEVFCGADTVATDVEEAFANLACE
jgi:hypothetical protein